MLKTRYIVYTALALLGVSFLGYFYGTVNSVGFVFFGLLGLILGLWRREYLIYLLYLELTLGSFGYLLSFSTDGLNLPLRILLFLIIMSLWFFDMFRLIVSAKIEVLSSKSLFKNKILVIKEMSPKVKQLTLSFIIFILLWILGIVHGYLRGAFPSNIFFDANSYLYLLLILPIVNYINTKEKFNQLIKVIIIGSSLLALETFALFIIFIKVDNLSILELIYKWIRDFRIGEITSLKNGAYRIFIQSQIYLLVGLFLILVLDFYKKISFRKYLFYLIILAGALYISLSRSFWVGFFAGFFILILILFYKKESFKSILRFVIKSVAIIFASILLISLFIPKNSSLIGNRLKIGESALNSRISQLEPLLPAIKNSPLIGYGFGKTLTFKSFDPRVSAVLKTGEYTTYAFEWGYLDIVLKMGVIGLFSFLYFIFTIIYLLFKKMQSGDIYSVWGLTIVFVLLSIHMFTPYLNHPLGIGMLIIGALVGIRRE